MAIKDDAMIVVGGVVLVVIAVWYAKSMASDAIDSVTDTVKETIGGAVDWTAQKATEVEPYINPISWGEKLYKMTH